MREFLSLLTLAVIAMLIVLFSVCSSSQGEAARRESREAFEESPYGISVHGEGCESPLGIVGVYRGQEEMILYVTQCNKEEKENE